MVQPASVVGFAAMAMAMGCSCHWQQRQKNQCVDDRMRLASVRGRQHDDDEERWNGLNLEKSVHVPGMSVARAVLLWFVVVLLPVFVRLLG